MKNISEKLMCLMLLLWIIAMFVNNTNKVNGHKKCCIKTAQEVYEYEGWVVKE
jgi:hypothetical protein